MYRDSFIIHAGSQKSDVCKCLIFVSVVTIYCICYILHYLNRLMVMGSVDGVTQVVWEMAVFPVDLLLFCFIH